MIALAVLGLALTLVLADPLRARTVAVALVLGLVMISAAVLIAAVGGVQVVV